MSDTTESNDERPCLHCLIGEVIDDFYAEYGSLSGEQETIVEVITALAKTVAEMTFGAVRAAPADLGPFDAGNFAVRGGVCKRTLDGHAALKR